MKKLCEIINCKYKVPIKGIETDSRKIKKDYLFVAIKGLFTNHEDFINDAVNNGCSAIISEKYYNVNIPIVIVKNVNNVLLEILSKYYDNIEQKFRFIGITGTDGKTTTASIVSKILDCAYIGTNGINYKNYYNELENTTPDICSLYKYLVKLYEMDCKTIVMEVSSEALLHGRVDNINFFIAGLTNITEDHLNIHKNISNYIDNKKKLFSLVSTNGYSILNYDDKNYKNVKKCCKHLTYGRNSKSDFKIKNINLKDKKFTIKYRNNEYKINTKLPFLYNVYNRTLAFAIAYLYKINTNEIIKRISTINKIDGRSEYLKFGQKYDIILDYAHTYNGILNLINNIKNNKTQKIIVVTGAAGGREKQKRAKIGKMLLEKVDLVIFTMDDPRYEDVNNIINEMISKTPKSNYIRIINRQKAIFKAFDIASENDIVLVIGKGRDNYMAIKNKKVKYSDYEVIKKYFLEKNKEI